MLDLDRIEDQIQSPRIIWSTSALKSIGTCGKQYYLRYRDPESVSELTPPLAFGSSIHKLIELLHTEKIWEERVWQRRWDDVWYDYSSQVNWGNYRKISFDKLGPQMIGSYIDKNRDAKVIESEIKFEFEIDGFPVRGVIDQIRQLPGNTLQIVDFKTSKDPMDLLLLRADPQWTFYYLYAREMYPKKKISMSYYHLRSGKLITTPRRDSDREVVVEMLKEAKARVDQQMFARNIGHHCTWCPYRQTCLGDIAKNDA